MRSFVDIIRFQLFAHIINGNIALNVSDSRLFQIVRHLQSVNILQTDSRAPCRSPFALMWLCHTLVGFEIKVLLFALVSHSCISFQVFVKYYLFLIFTLFHLLLQSVYFIFYFYYFSNGIFLYIDRWNTNCEGFNSFC